MCLLADVDLQRIVARVAVVGQRRRDQSIRIPEKLDWAVPRILVIRLRERAWLLRLDKADDRSLGQLAAIDELVEDREPLAARDGRVISWQKAAARLLRQQAVVVSALEIVQEPVFLDDHLVEIESAPLLGGVVA